MNNQKRIDFAKSVRIQQIFSAVFCTILFIVAQVTVAFDLNKEIANSPELQTSIFRWSFALLVVAAALIILMFVETNTNIKAWEKEAEVAP